MLSSLAGHQGSLGVEGHTKKTPELLEGGPGDDLQRLQKKEIRKKTMQKVSKGKVSSQA